MNIPSEKVSELIEIMNEARDVFREMVEDRLFVFGSKNKGMLPGAVY